MINLYNFLKQRGETLAVGFGVLFAVVFAITIYMGTKSGGYSLSTLSEMEDKSQVNCFNFGLWTMIVMIIFSFIIMLFGVFSDIIKNAKKGKGTIIGFGLIILTFVALYFTSSYDSGGRFDAYWSKDPFYITESLSKFISAGMLTVGILTIVAFLSILIFEIRAFFK